MAKQSKKFTEQREAVLSQIAAIAAKAEKEERELTVEEVSMRDEFAAQAGKLQGRAISAKADEADAKVAKAAEARNDIGTGEQRSNDVGGAVHVRSSEHTYVKGGDTNYLHDLATVALNPGPAGGAASERLKRHGVEMSRDAEEARNRINAGSARSWSKHASADEYLVSQVRAGMAASGASETQARTGDLNTTTSADGGVFVPPAYLTAEYVPYARPGRPFADSVTKMDLPAGTMSINIPRVTSGTAVGPQSAGAENAAVVDTALATDYDTFPVTTIAGAQTLSQQLIDRAPIDFSDVTFKDLTLALAQQVDANCISGAGSGGVVKGVLNTGSITTTTWTTSTPTFAGFWNQVASTKAAIASGRFLPATHMFLTPNRWEWLESQLDDTGRPLFSPQDNGPFNAAQVSPDGAVAQGVTGGRFQGLTVYQDFNVPATVQVSSQNSDIVVICKADDMYLYESPVVARALPQTYGNQLTVLLQVWEYAAFTANRYPVSAGIITGSGMEGQYLTFPA
jgi:HK97 family phage major capsid protein